MTSPRSQSDVESFYHLDGVNLEDAECQGLACFVARQASSSARQAGRSSHQERVYCLGKCYAAPARGDDSQRPAIGVRSRRPVVLERIADGGVTTLAAYRASGGMKALDTALSLSSEEVVRTVEASQLRGRGGAGFPTGKKWRSVASQPRAVKHVVANLDEGDPGAYIDRFIAELDPFALLEGMAIAAHAVGAKRGWIYARCEYPQAIAQLRSALDAAQAARIGSSGFLGTAFSFQVDLVVGRGSYLCGEETALLSSLEGRRPVARLRPPYVSERGLNGQPTLVNNVETLASIPWILRHGAGPYAEMGCSSSRGTKVVSLNSLFCRPGLYEVEFGVPLHFITDECGGGLRSGRLGGLIIGGPLAGVIPPRLLDTPFGFDELHAIGASVGHGGVVAFDERTSLAELVRHVFSFGAYESCGKCTPCRLGTSSIERIFAAACQGTADKDDRRQYRAIVEALRSASLCGFGTGLAEFARSIERHFTTELLACFK